MTLIGYIHGTLETPIFVQYGRYYLLTCSGYKSFGSKTIINQYLKNRNLKISRIS